MERSGNILAAVSPLLADFESDFLRKVAVKLLAGVRAGDGQSGIAAVIVSAWKLNQLVPCHDIAVKMNKQATAPRIINPFR